ncbi:MAG: histidinol dehydrogenase [Clostridia bacterium]|nr:histidinol dehydrogenase [Clostridia bacterium]
MIRIMNYGQLPYSEIFAREEQKTNVADIVMDIIYTVRKEGDAALLAYNKKFDGCDLTSLEVTEAEIEEAFAAVEPRFLEILRNAEKNIRAFHEKQVRTSFIINETAGVVTGQKITPIEKVGLYVPGGTAAYPSTVLMDSVPAKIAGCSEIVMVTPPGKDGKVNPVILAAAKIAGVQRIFKVGGAQAVAALAYGTESIPKVDKIVGPGNAFVAEAKKQVFGQVSIDMIAGPSEILVVADGKSNPAHVAADLLSQAEHDKLASAVLVTDSQQLAEAVQAELERQIPLLSRAEIARTSIDNNGKIIVAEDLRVVIDIANEIAPEHLELMVDNPFDYLDGIKHAGSIFMGRNCPEALGDYYAGPNHTLPTSGTARFSSPLSVDDFVKKSQYTYYTKEALERVGRDVAFFAEKEGLQAHAKSVTVRLDEEK